MAPDLTAVAAAIPTVAPSIGSVPAGSPISTLSSQPAHPGPVAQPLEPVVASGIGVPPEPAEAAFEGHAPRRRGLLAAAGAVVLVALLGGASFAVFGGGSDSEAPSVATESPIVEEPTASVDVAPVVEPVVVDDVAEPETDDAAVADEAAAPIDQGASDQTDADATDTEADAEQSPDAEQDPDGNAGESPAVSDTTVTAEPADATAAEPEAETPVEPGDDADVATPVLEVAESTATVRNGQIFLEGAVPSQAVGDELTALAAEILGADNVFNNYIVDPNASDPNLGNITVEDTINFRTDSAVLLDPDNPLLAQGVALMNIRPAMTITIVGHTDDRGSQGGNETLSLERAEAVKAFFVDNGIDADRLTTIGAGANEPIASNDTAAGRSENRRIQFILENILGEA